MSTQNTMTRIAREAQDAAARGMSINDACPYPFGTAEARHFKAMYLQTTGPRAERGDALPVAITSSVGYPWKAVGEEMAAELEQAADFPAYPPARYREAAATLRAMATLLQELDPFATGHRASREHELNRVKPCAAYAVRLNCDGSVSTWRQPLTKGRSIDDAATAMATACNSDQRKAALRQMIEACTAELGENA